jgi:hypothetical protein
MHLQALKPKGNDLAVLLYPDTPEAAERRSDAYLFIAAMNYLKMECEL